MGLGGAKKGVLVLEATSGSVVANFSVDFVLESVLLVVFVPLVDFVVEVGAGLVVEVEVLLFCALLLYIIAVIRIKLIIFFIMTFLFQFVNVKKYLQ